MKKLALPPKVFTRARVALTALGLGLFTLGALVKGCKSSDEELALLALSEQKPSNIADKIVTTVQISPFISVRDQTTDQVYGAVHDDSCKPGSPLEFLSHLDVFGLEKLSFKIVLASDRQRMTWSLGDRSIELSDATHLTKGLSFCSSSSEDLRRSLQETGKDQLVTDGSATAVFVELLSQILPDCEISLEPGGFHCAPQNRNMPSLAQLEHDLDSLETTVFLKLKRQSYAISRKIVLTRQLIEVLGTSSDFPDALSVLCGSIQNGSSVEVPILLTAPLLTRGLCSPELGDEPLKRSMAQLALVRGVQEIRSLVALYEEQSKIGTLSIRIPLPEGFSSELGVTIEPAAETIAQAYSSLLFKAQLHSSYCLDPLFANTTDSVLYTSLQDLRHQPAHSFRCLSVTDEHPEHSKTVYNYLAAHLTSERVFVITNGKGIILRLVEGTYRYVIAPRPAGLHSQPIEEKEPQRTEGTFEWRGQRPSQLIQAS
jgi:hypothetical protein